MGGLTEDLEGGFFLKEKATRLCGLRGTSTLVSLPAFVGSRPMELLDLHLIDLE
jgi:hypothetical protein